MNPHCKPRSRSLERRTRRPRRSWRVDSTIVAAVLWIALVVAGIVLGRERLVNEEGFMLLWVVVLGGAACVWAREQFVGRRKR